jgi:hypothetical protein
MGAAGDQGGVLLAIAAKGVLLGNCGGRALLVVAFGY